MVFHVHSARLVRFGPQVRAAQAGQRISSLGGRSVSSAFFAGNVVQKVDGKRRVSVPASFRAVLGDGTTFFAFPSLTYHGAVECRIRADMETLNEQIDDLDPFSDEQDHLSMAIFGRAHPLTPDKDGRVVLPDELCRHAEIVDNVTFVGVGRYFRLYDPAAYEAHQKQASGRAAASRRALGRRPRNMPGPDGSAGGA